MYTYSINIHCIQILNKFLDWISDRDQSLSLFPSHLIATAGFAKKARNPPARRAPSGASLCHFITWRTWLTLLIPKVARARVVGHIVLAVGHARRRRPFFREGEKAKVAAAASHPRPPLRGAARNNNTRRLRLSSCTSLSSPSTPTSSSLSLSPWARIIARIRRFDSRRRTDDVPLHVSRSRECAWVMDRRLPCHSCEALNGLEWPEIARANCIVRPHPRNNGRCARACACMGVYMQMRDTKGPGDPESREITIFQMIDILSYDSISNRPARDRRDGSRFQLRARFFPIRL